MIRSLKEPDNHPNVCVITIIPVRSFFFYISRRFSINNDILPTKALELNNRILDLQQTRHPRKKEKSR